MDICWLLGTTPSASWVKAIINVTKDRVVYRATYQGTKSCMQPVVMAIPLFVRPVSDVFSFFVFSLFVHEVVLWWSGEFSPSILDCLLENRVYSWGRGDNGSLGIPVSSLGKKAKDGVPVTSLPKPIFGSLHAVTSLACRYWHTIIVAGQLRFSFCVRFQLRGNSSRKFAR